VGFLPKVANVDFSRLKIEPGDRVIVRYWCDLSEDERRKLRKSVSRWAGSDVEVLLVDVKRFDVDVERAVRVSGLGM